MKGAILMMVKLVEIKELEDGSAIATFDYDEDFKKLVKKTYNLKRFSKKKAEKLILSALEDAIKEAKMKKSCNCCTKGQFQWVTKVRNFGKSLTALVKSWYTYIRRLK
jgi:hypothetical protein